MSGSVLIACAHCLRTNRVPTARLAQRPTCGRCRSELLSGEPVALDESSFSKVVECTELPVVVDFWAAWSAPCRMMAPAFEAAACEMRTRARFARVDAEQAPAIASRYRVRSIPTMILFRDGREVNRTSGAVDTGVLLRWVQSEEARSAVPKSS